MSPYRTVLLTCLMAGSLGAKLSGEELGVVSLTLNVKNDSNKPYAISPFVLGCSPDTQISIGGGKQNIVIKPHSSQAIPWKATGKRNGFFGAFGVEMTDSMGSRMEILMHPLPYVCHETIQGKTFDLSGIRCKGNDVIITSDALAKNAE